ncbi:MAG: hypothetical protein COA70_09150 [Planctomycetota bacterium]|nr:MAG: hypothetical protein COA70_09150 [Planctomycetota bacterium]
MRIFLLALFLTLPFASCSVTSFFSVNSSATIIMASGWQASVTSHYDTIEVEHLEGSEEATFLTAGREIFVSADRIVIDGKQVITMPPGKRIAIYEEKGFSVRVEAAK